MKFVQIERGMFELVQSMTYTVASSGTIIITEYWPLDVFRPGLLSNCEVLVPIGLHV